MINSIVENNFIEKLTRHFLRSPFQKNSIQQTDAEIIRTENDDFLAITTDSIVEEIACGLYDNPYLVGWMTVMVNLSDIAAVGARPLGIMLSEVIPSSCPDHFLHRLQRGIRDACTACETYVLGGDTNSGEKLLMTGTAIGSCKKGQFLTRVGCQPGEILYSTNQLGIGNAFALAQLGKQKNYHINFQPHARIKEGQLLNGIATACMDTSDGVISTLDQLMRLNNVGFELNVEWQSALHPDAKLLADALGLPSWLLLAGQHGEFELIFTIPKNSEIDFLYRASKNEWYPIPIGKVIDETAIKLNLYGETTTIDTGRIRNLPIQMNGNVENYVNELLTIDKEIQKGEHQYVSH